MPLLLKSIPVIGTNVAIQCLKYTLSWEKIVKGIKEKKSKVNEQTTERNTIIKATIFVEKRLDTSQIAMVPAQMEETTDSKAAQYRLEIVVSDELVMGLFPPNRHTGS